MTRTHARGGTGDGRVICREDNARFLHTIVPGRRHVNGAGRGSSRLPRRGK